MYGASIEQDFPHIAFEQEQLKRKLEVQRLIDANQPRPQHPRRSLAAIFGRITPQLDTRAMGKQSPVVPS